MAQSSGMNRTENGTLLSIVNPVLRKAEDLSKVFPQHNPCRVLEKVIALKSKRGNFFLLVKRCRPKKEKTETLSL